MTTSLAISQNESEFIANLNMATGYNSIPFFPHLKFNAEEGIWYEETPDKDEENKPIYAPIGNKIEMNIITTRKMVQSDYKAKEKLYSKEFQDSYVELYDQNKQIVLKGMYNVLKLTNPDLKYIQVIYAYVNDKPYRIKLGGSKLSKWFPYFGSFKNDNPARYITTAEVGQQIKVSSSVKYFELNFTKGTKVELETVVKRVNDINNYLSAYAKSAIKQEIIGNEPPVEEPQEILSADAMDEIHL